MRILVTGSSGLIGSAVTRHFSALDHELLPLHRSGGQPVPGKPVWDSASGLIDLSAAGDLDTVIHLAGENVGQRWTDEVKRRIRESRVKGTALLAQALAALPKKPKVMLSASATGFYGNRRAQWVDESSGPGTGFLAEVTRDWENATAAAVEVGIRVVHLRFGVVLTPAGGALARMLTTFRMGLGGRLGNGEQYWSWIALHDLLAAMQHVLQRPDISGAVNCTSPNPVTNADFTQVLGDVLRRPAMLHVPAFALKLMLGEMAEDALLSSARVQPAVLERTGFQWKYPTLQAALQHILRK